MARRCLRRSWSLCRGRLSVALLTGMQAMLATIGAATVDDLFVDVPEVARLDGPIHGLPMHASEMAVRATNGRRAELSMVVFILFRFGRSRHWSTSHR